MRSEAPEHVFLGPELPEIEPGAPYVPDLAQFPGENHVAKRHEGRVVFEQMSDHEHAPRRVGPSAKVLGLARLPGQRLFDEDMLARIECPQCHGVVGWNWRGQDHCPN